MKESERLRQDLAEKNPWKNNANRILLATTMNCYRNIEKFLFSSHLAPQARQQIISLVWKALIQSQVLKSPYMLRIEECSPIDKELLFEHFLSTQSYYQAHSGEGFIVDGSGSSMVVLNMCDHIEILASDTEEEFEQLHARIVKLDMEIGKTLSYAYSPRFGFLTADPKHAGTGLVVHVFLQLPALIHKNALNAALAKYAAEGITLTGLHGSPHEYVGDLIVARNNYCLGLTEEAILASLRHLSLQLMTEENQLRKEIQSSGNPEIKDKISRAFGLLTCGYQLETGEALNALSLLKLGVDLGWVENVSVTRLNELFFLSRRAHLLSLNPPQTQPQDLGHTRADFLHGALHDVRLSIDNSVKK